MKIWEATVSVPTGKSYPDQPRTMRHEADNMLQAKAYFESFGKLLNMPRIVGESK
jgi:hypothetical protein